MMTPASNKMGKWSSFRFCFNFIFSVGFRLFSLFFAFVCFGRFPLYWPRSSLGSLFGCFCLFFFALCIILYFEH